MMLARSLCRPLLLAAVWILVAASGRWRGVAPSRQQRIYFANHSSHIDTVALWSALPPSLRAVTRPVAAFDYWGCSAWRRFIALSVLNAVLVERAGERSQGDLLQPLMDALGQGDSLIIFPEGTRSPQKLPGPFKSGLFRLGQRFPQVELIPVYLENLHRSMPKGSLMPVPIACTVHFGAAIFLLPDETKDDFLARARACIVELAP